MTLSLKFQVNRLIGNGVIVFTDIHTHTYTHTHIHTYTHTDQYPKIMFLDSGDLETYRKLEIRVP